jgi:hypothetical protein
MTSIMAHQHGITGWSEFGFGQLAIDHQEIPVLGLLQHGANAPAPPTTSGHPLAAADQIELGAVTMRALGLKVGDKVTVGAARRPFTVVGTVTLPSMGTVLTDHVSLGRGAMMEEDACWPRTTSSPTPKLCSPLLMQTTPRSAPRSTRRR